jgi:hypothetical protein
MMFYTTGNLDGLRSNGDGPFSNVPMSPFNSHEQHCSFLISAPSFGCQVGSSPPDCCHLLSNAEPAQNVLQQWGNQDLGEKKAMHSTTQHPSRP